MIIIIGAAPMMPMASAAVNMRPGDWICPGCNDHQFARKASYTMTCYIIMLFLS